MKGLKYLFFAFFFLIISPSLLTSLTNEDCMMCHSDTELTTTRRGRTISLYVDINKFSNSVHKELGCIDCHTDADVEEFPHPERLENVTCGNCHGKERDDFYTGIHGKALKRGAPYAPTCKECHGKHSIFPPLQH